MGYLASILSSIPALQAFSLAHIAKTQRDESVLKMARMSYGFSLLQLQQAVMRGRMDINALTAVNFITLYEVCCLARSSTFLKN